MTESNQKILLPKIKKMEFKSKILLDPADFRKGLPKSKLPELTSKGLILSLQNKKVGIAKMTGEGSLKLNVIYEAQVLCLLGRYIQIRVIDDYSDTWIGNFLGIHVKGRGGQGDVRACRVLKIQSNHIVVEGVGQSGNQMWQKLYKRTEKILEEYS